MGMPLGAIVVLRDDDVDALKIVFREVIII